MNKIIIFTCNVTFLYFYKQGSISNLGTSCLASSKRSTRSRARLRLLSLKKLVAKPKFPIRPVLPIRCTYSSTSDGRSKFITCRTCGISKPIMKNKLVITVLFYSFHFTSNILTSGRNGCCYENWSMTRTETS